MAKKKVTKKITIGDKMTIRLGYLTPELVKWCEANNKTPSHAVRLAVAKMVGAKMPDEPKPGNPDFGPEFHSNRKK